jgi:hypothetical protein
MYVAGVLATPKSPLELFELFSHLCFGLAEIARRGGQYPALYTHLLASATWLVRHLVLLHITSYLGNQ